MTDPHPPTADIAQTAMVDGLANTAGQARSRSGAAAVEAAAGFELNPALKPVTVPVEEGLLPAFDLGSGTPVVCVHGMLGDRRSWAEFAPRVARKHRVIAYSQRYFGDADWSEPGRRFNTAGHAGDLAGLIEALGLAPCHVIGWGYGGAVATLAARARPEQFASLTLHDPMLPSVVDATARAHGPIGAYNEAVATLLATVRDGDLIGASRRFLELTMSLEPGQFESCGTPLQKALAETNGRTFALQMAMPQSPITSGDLKALAQADLPVALTRAEHTTDYYRAVADALLAIEPRLKTLPLPGAAHWAPVVQPDLFASSYLDHIAELAG